MTVIKIPTADELSKRLGGLDRLLTAKRWERAAIVWAFTTNEGPGGDNRAMLETPHSFPVTVAAFARLGHVGLTDRNTVARYRAAWQTVINSGEACSVAPGDEIELPSVGWPGIERPQQERIDRVAESAGIGTESARRLIESPSTMAAAIKADEGLAEVARNAVLDRARERHAAEPKPEPKVSPAESKAQEVEREEFYGPVFDLSHVGERSSALVIAAQRLVTELAKVREAGRTLDATAKDIAATALRDTRALLDAAEQLLTAEASVADSAAEWLKSNS